MFELNFVIASFLLILRFVVVCQVFEADKNLNVPEMLPSINQFLAQSAVSTELCI